MDFVTQLKQEKKKNKLQQILLFDRGKLKTLGNQHFQTLNS